MSKEINRDIEVGDYVRSRNGSIGKVTKIEDDKYLYENKELITFIGNVVKHSKNIIDLIEVGDIVNGYRIDLIDPWGVLVHEARGINRSGFSIPVAQYEEDIKTVETHEQHEQNRYTVERS